MLINFMLVLLLVVSTAIAKSVTRDRHPDVGLNIKALVPKYGYPFEEHKVITEDGYILELHRIPHGQTKTSRQNRPVVLILAGMLSSSDAWIIGGPQSGLGYILADSGYDVWLGNHRGTTWSRKHLTLDPKIQKKQFWEFSYHEMGVYDNTALIDYILKVTNQAKLFYIGHSQGSTSFFAMASEFPEYNNKIRLMVALGPVTYTENLKSPLVRLLLPFTGEIWAFMQENELYGILKHNKLFTAVAQTFCNDDAPTQGLCVLLISLIGGFNIPQTNKSLLPVIASSAPAGASWKQFSHYFQGLKTGDFRRYDYGEAQNLARYGQVVPPKYNLEQVISPVALYYGNNDYLATEKNALRTKDALPNVVLSKRVKNFNHLDFVWGIDVSQLLYNDVLKLMKHY